MFIWNTSALPRPIVPDSISVWLVFWIVEPFVKVFVLEPSVLLNVASILTLWPLKFAPKSSFSEAPVGEPVNSNIASPSWLLPVKFNTSPTAPVPPEPVVIIVTVKSSLESEENVSSVPALIVPSPLDDNVETNCLLIE